MRTVATLFLALALPVAGCAHTHPGQDSAAPAPVPQDDVVLDVQNHSWSDLDVYVIAGNERARVGDATSQTTAHLRIPAEMVAHGESIQVRTVPIGGGRPFLTDRISLTPGQHVRLVVEAQSTLSSWMVERSGAEW